MTVLSKLISIMQVTIIPLLFAAACILIIWALPGDYDHDLAVLVNKRDLLVSAKTPRMIFIGGSNLITLESRQIEEILNKKGDSVYSVVNLGLWGGLNMERYLDEIKTYCRPGDIVIICQEYATLLSEGYFRFIREPGEAEKYFFLMRPARILEPGFDCNAFFNATKYIILLDQLKIKTYIQALIDGTIIRPGTGGYYRYKENYTARGDRKSPFKIVRPLGETGIRLQNPNTSNLNYLKNFHNYACGHGIMMFFAFPPFPDREYRRNKIYIDSLVYVIRDELGVDILLMPEASVYPESCFADTVNHLQPHCEKMRTGALLDQLVKIK